MTTYNKTPLTDTESGDDAPVIMPQVATRSFKLKMLAAVALGALALCGVHLASGRNFGGDVGITTDFNGITTLDSTDMDPKVATVLKTMSAWGKGLLHGDSCKTLARELWTQDVVFDARGPMHPSNMWRLYNGIEDGCKWLKNLELMDFKDFTMDEIYPGEGDKVMAIVSYTPTLASGAKKASHKVQDAQIWTIRDGKVASAQFLFGEPEATDALFVDAAPKPTSPDDQTKFIQSLYAKWAQGKFHGGACYEEAKQYFTDDIVVGASAPLTHTSMYKVYTGLQGFCNWIENLEALPFKDFKFPALYTKASGVSVVKQTYTISGSAYTDFVKWTFKDGKVSNTAFVWGDVKGRDKYFAALKVSTVMGMFGAWGKGLFHGDKCMETGRKFYSEDSVLDFRAPMKNTGMFKMYKSVDGLCDLMQNIERYNFQDFRIDNVYPTAGNQVVVSVSYKPKLASDDSSKSLAVHRVSDGQIWNVKDGKMVRGEILIGQPPVLDLLLGQTTPINSDDDDTKLVQEVFKAWGAGKFHGDACLSSSQKFFTNDIVVDCSAPMENTDMMMVYRGMNEFCNKWLPNLEQMKFKNFKPFSMYSKSPGAVVAQVTYGLEGDDADTTFIDTQKWTVTNGKISNFQILWGDSKGIDNYFSH